MATIYTPSSDHITIAAAHLQKGEVVAFPTETVYGLGADATNSKAIDKIYKAKGRPSFNPLIIHVWGAAQAALYAEVSTKAEILMRHFWPGPLTLILPQKSDSPIVSNATAGLSSIAIRCPNHPVAQDLLRAVDLPIAAPSANRSGSISPTTAEHVSSSLGDRIDIILSGGKSEIGLESTILDLSSERPQILRPGAILKEEIEELIGPLYDAIAAEDKVITAPGMLKSHYAPALPVKLNVHFPTEGDAFLAFGPTLIDTQENVLNLSPTGDLDEAAKNLFAMLRALDQPHFKAIAVMPIPEIGLGIAINDRLKRAAADRD
ncbi:MAG: threonylcarbamoyl-AMP synthase [Alphaproteobacteria bacterium]|jgi:L-threonylcarbamoyladenylate synthase|nr:threonylcarbamoyl-AMP synthase [Alphaproteobacteria bacterium]MBP9877800.1 threonylcarbamoyl-AMP synthase [Alphaproteobacteria bacterium]